MHLLGSCRQPVSKVWMGQADQSLGSLSRREPLQICAAVLGDYVMDICARCRDRARKPRDNLADLAVLDRRLEGDEGHSSLGGIGSSDEIELAAGGGKLMASYVLRVAGPCQVHFNR